MRLSYSARHPLGPLTSRGWRQESLLRPCFLTTLKSRRHGKTSYVGGILSKTLKKHPELKTDIPKLLETFNSEDLNCACGVKTQHKIRYCAVSVYSHRRGGMCWYSTNEDGSFRDGHLMFQASRPFFKEHPCDANIDSNAVLGEPIMKTMGPH